MMTAIAVGAQGDDARWFADNPKASRRLRRVLPGETMPGGFRAPARAKWAVVVQIEPGLRWRAFKPHKPTEPEMAALERQLLQKGN